MRLGGKLTRLQQQSQKLVQIAILLTFAMMPMWIKLPDAPPPFTARYVLGFAVVVPLLATIALWLLTGLPGLRSFLRDGRRVAWWLLLVMLASWATLTQAWAFVATTQTGVAQNAALQLWLVAGFLLVVLCVPPAPRLLLGVLIASMLVHGLIGGLQVMQQSSLGLPFEFALNPMRSGVSVIQSGDVRWLRPYGLLPHPNIFAGVIVVGLMASAAWLLDARRVWRWAGRMAFVCGWWLLLLTFSRGAWLGFAVGALAVLPLILRDRAKWRRLLPVVGVAVMLGLLFLWLYQPLIFARVGVGNENTEMRSIADRAVFTQIAVDAILNHAVQGVGGGNFAWYASHYLFNYTDYDLRGDNVHHVWLLVWSEYGLVGLLLLYALIAWGLDSALIRIKHAPDKVWCIAYLGAFVAFLVIATFDHYMWTMIHMQTLWLGLLALSFSEQSTS